MVREEITIKGMHCSSCEKTITRALKREGITVESISFKTGKATVSHQGVSSSSINALLGSKGYSIAEGRPVTGKDATTRSTYQLEKTILVNGVLTLAILLIIQAALAFLLYTRLPGYSGKYLLAFLYVPVAIVTNIVALWHQRAYRQNVSCMTGMMVGMTIGMSTGFSIGGIVGLINGMFTGALVGVFAGMAAGAYAGRCCGTMGTMEGMMAGLMGGTMGAMLSVMLVSDHVEIFLPLLILTNTIILGGLMRVVVEEHEGQSQDAQPWSLPAVLGASMLLMLVISAIMLLAPKGLY